MNALLYFSVVTVILLDASEAGVVKRAGYNFVEVTNPDNKILADAFLRSDYPVVQFFSFSNSKLWGNGSAEMSKASNTYSYFLTFYLSYNCADQPAADYCPPDVTQTTYRFYKQGELKEEKEKDILTSEMIHNIVKDL